MVTELMNPLTKLSETIGPDRIKADPSATETYAVDGLRPGAVIFPRNMREVSQVVKTANQENLSIIPWGSGSKMGSGRVPSRVDWVVSASRMNHMLDVDTANLTITVEAGGRFRDVQARLATEDDRCYLPLEDLATPQDELICSDRSNSGCFLPMDPPFSETATMGGIVAANSSGPRRLLYRFPRDLLLGVRFVAPNGDVVGTGGKTVKNVSGYDISKLMVGSFGTLGFICEMTFKLLPLPEQMETLFVTFDSLDAACGLVEQVLDTPLLPAAVEIMNRNAWGALRLSKEEPQGAGGFGVAVAMEAFRPAVERMQHDILQLATRMGAKGNARFQEEDHRRFWLMVSQLQKTVRDQSPNLIVFQLNYPISVMQEAALFAEKTLSQSGMDHTLLVHGGTGSLVGTLAHEAHTRSEETVVGVLRDLLDGCREKGGNLIILSAPPHLKSRLRMWGDPGNDLKVMRRIKTRVDPSGIFSPGRFWIGN